jgi:cell division protein FtsB
MRKIRTIIAALLIAVFTLGALNVSTAGQRDRLRQKVRALNERVVALNAEVVILTADLQLWKTRLDSIAETHRDHIDYLLDQNISTMVHLDDHESRIEALEAP